MISVINFSGRLNGNCKQVADLISKSYDAVITNFSDIKIQPCGSCNYECFKELERCKITDGINSLYGQIMKSDLIIYIVPNYCDYPCANFFIFSERGCGYFNKCEKLLNQYTNIPKKFIVISNSSIFNIKNVFNYHTNDLDILVLSPKDYNKKSIDGDILESENCKNEIIKFLK